MCSHTHIDVDARHSVWSQYVSGSRIRSAKEAEVRRPSAFDASLKMAFKTDRVEVVRKHFVLNVKARWEGWWAVKSGYGSVRKKTHYVTDSGAKDWTPHVYRIWKEDGVVVMQYKQNEAHEDWWPKEGPIQLFSGLAPVDVLNEVLAHPGFESPTVWDNMERVHANVIRGRRTTPDEVEEWNRFFETVPTPGTIPSVDDPLAFKWLLPDLYKRASHYLTIPPVPSSAPAAIEFNPEPSYEVRIHDGYTASDRNRDRKRRIKTNKLRLEKEAEISRSEEILTRNQGQVVTVEIEERGPRFLASSSRVTSTVSDDSGSQCEPAIASDDSAPK